MTDKKENSELDLDKTLAETTHKVEVFYVKNKKQVTYALGGLAAAIAIYFAFTGFYLKPLEKEAQSAAFRAQQYFEIDSFNLALNGNDNFMGFEALSNEYGLTKIGNLSHYYAGLCNLHLGNYEAAIDHLEDFDTDNKLIRPLAEGAIGDAYVELGDIEKGVKYYMKAARSGKNKLTSPIYLKKAGIAYEELKEYSSALEVYTKIKKEYRESMEAQDIDKYISRVEGMNSAN